MKEASNQTAIRLLNTQVTNMLFKTTSEFDYGVTDTIDLKLGHDILFSDSDNKHFIVMYVVELSNEENTLELSITFKALFETSDIINDSFKKSSFIETNAPAIAFPYLRAFISNFSVNAGLKPIVLPTMNFTKLSERLK